MSAVKVLSANIAAARKAKGWSQHDAAAAIGMGMAQYGRIERGEVDPRLTTIARVAAGLEVGVLDLLAGID